MAQILLSRIKISVISIFFNCLLIDHEISDFFNIISEKIVIIKFRSDYLEIWLKRLPIIEV